MMMLKNVIEIKNNISHTIFYKKMNLTLKYV